MNICAAAAIAACLVSPVKDVSKAPTTIRLAQSSLNCGIAPIPPIGCRVGSCVCDSSGNCNWQFICN